MESWMLIQGVGLVGGLACVVSAFFAFKNDKKPLAVVALLVGAGLGFMGLNATALTTDPVEEEQLAPPEESELGADDFDAPL